MRRLRAAPLLLPLALLLWGAPASAHGRLPALGQLAFFPDAPQTIVVRATFGLVISDDGGETWRWICAAVTGVDATVEDPRIALLPPLGSPLDEPDRAFFAGTFNGLRRGDGGCRWGYPDEALEGHYIIDVHRESADPSHLWALHSEGGIPDHVYRSVDGGRSFAQMGSEITEMLLERILVAPSDPRRVYLSGARPPLTAEERVRAFLWASEDGGESYEVREIPLLDRESNLFVLAVDPTDPDRIFARVKRRRVAPDDPLERLVRSVDGGRSWETVLELLEISDVVLSEDGQGVWVGSQAEGGLYRSMDGGDHFETLDPGLTVRCLGRHAGILYVCGDGYRDPFALARSEDGGQTLVPILQYTELGLIFECAECEQVSYICSQWYPDLAFDLRLDAGEEGLPDGTITGAPRDASRPAHCLPDGRVLDAGERLDAGPAGSLDAGPEPPPPAGCACRASGGGGRRGGAEGLLAGLALALSALLRARRARRPRRV